VVAIRKISGRWGVARAGGLIGATLLLAASAALAVTVNGCQIGPGAYCPGANLSGADLVNANLAGAHPPGANLSRARLRDAHLAGANLFEADLREAQLPHANLTRVDRSRANLSYADAQRADLSRANLSRAAKTAVEERALQGVLTSRQLPSDAGVRRWGESALGRVSVRESQLSGESASGRISVRLQRTGRAFAR
jgi:Pentapeptide repeats (8 copies)